MRREILTRDAWKGIAPETTHTKEVMLESFLNRHLIMWGMKAERCERPTGGIYTPWDITVNTFDLSQAKTGGEVVRIDAEAKSIVFPKNGIPEKSVWPRGPSWLNRKLMKLDLRDCDLYILHDRMVNEPNIIAATMLDLRKLTTVKEEDQHGDMFWPLGPENFGFLMTCYNDVAEYCHKVMTNGPGYVYDRHTDIRECTARPKNQHSLEMFLGGASA